MFASSLPTLPTASNPWTSLSTCLPKKDFLKRKFEEWYSGEIMKELEGRDIESAKL